MDSSILEIISSLVAQNKELEKRIASLELQERPNQSVSAESVPQFAGFLIGVGGSVFTGTTLIDLGGGGWTSTTYDNDAIAVTTGTLIDVSAIFTASSGAMAVPSDTSFIKGYLVIFQSQWASAGVAITASLSRSPIQNVGTGIVIRSIVANALLVTQGIVFTNVDGDIYLHVTSANTSSTIIRIIGILV